MTPANSRLAAGLCWIFVGIALALLGRPLDGVGGGLLTGAGVASIVLGVVLLSAARRGTGWLPSRDEKRP